jgi:hypothetical protein
VISLSDKLQFVVDYATMSATGGDKLQFVVDYATMSATGGDKLKFVVLPGTNVSYPVPAFLSRVVSF